jgi:hypothetical protein
VALGKSAEIVDKSLETAEDLGIFDSMRDGEGSGTEESPSGGFSDATDLENEDFVFVY